MVHSTVSRQPLDTNLFDLSSLPKIQKPYSSFPFLFPTIVVVVLKIERKFWIDICCDRLAASPTKDENKSKGVRTPVTKFYNSLLFLFLFLWMLLLLLLFFCQLCPLPVDNPLSRILLPPDTSSTFPLKVCWIFY